MKNVIVKIVLLMVLSTSTRSVIAQDSIPRPANMKHVGIFDSSDVLMYPDSCFVSGTVASYCNSAGCGVISSCGVIKIRLEGKHSLPSDEIYVVVPCLYLTDSSLGAQIKNLKILAVTNARYNTLPMIMNSYEAGNAPFYCVREADMFLVSSLRR